VPPPDRPGSPEVYFALVIDDPLGADELVSGDPKTMSAEETAAAITKACPQVIRKVTGAATGSMLDELRFVEVVEVRVEDDRAFAKIENATQVPTLKKVDGEWKNDKLGIDFSTLGLAGSAP
jgi:hypothetical protein